MWLYLVGQALPAPLIFAFLLLMTLRLDGFMPPLLIGSVDISWLLVALPALLAFGLVAASLASVAALRWAAEGQRLQQYVQPAPRQMCCVCWRFDELPGLWAGEAVHLACGDAFVGTGLQRTYASNLHCARRALHVGILILAPFTLLASSLLYALRLAIVGPEVSGLHSPLPWLLCAAPLLCCLGSAASWPLVLGSRHDSKWELAGATAAFLCCVLGPTAITVGSFAAIADGTLTGVPALGIATVALVPLALLGLASTGFCIRAICVNMRARQGQGHGFSCLPVLVWAGSIILLCTIAAAVVLAAEVVQTGDAGYARKYSFAGIPFLFLAAIGTVVRGARAVSTWRSSQAAPYLGAGPAIPEIGALPCASFFCWVRGTSVYGGRHSVLGRAWAQLGQQLSTKALETVASDGTPSPLTSLSHAMPPPLAAAVSSSPSGAGGAFYPPSLTSVQGLEMGSPAAQPNASAQQRGPDSTPAMLHPGLEPSRDAVLSALLAGRPPGGGGGGGMGPGPHSGSLLRPAAVASGRQGTALSAKPIPIPPGTHLTWKRSTSGAR